MMLLEGTPGLEVYVMSNNGISESNSKIDVKKPSEITSKYRDNSKKGISHTAERDNLLDRSEIERASIYTAQNLRCERAVRDEEKKNTARKQHEKRSIGPD